TRNSELVCIGRHRDRKERSTVKVTFQPSQSTLMGRRVRWLALIVLTACVGQSELASVNVRVNPSRTFQTIQGFGGSLTPFEDFQSYKEDLGSQLSNATRITYESSRLDAMYSALFQTLGISRARLAYRGFEPAAGQFKWEYLDTVAR